jgi:hypothetical protein
MGVLFAQATEPRPELDFYTTSAQVLPVLLLALAFEFRGTGMVFLPSALERVWDRQAELDEAVRTATFGPQTQRAREHRPRFSFQPTEKAPAERDAAEAKRAAPKQEPRPRMWPSVYTAFVALALIAGEAVALVVLATESPREFTKIFVGVVLGLGGLAILGPVLALQANTLVKALSRKKREGFDCVDCVFLGASFLTILLVVGLAVFDPFDWFE